MTSIIGYTYAAAFHCVRCTQKDEFEIDRDHPHARDGVDEHGVSLAAIDHERNLIYPVFSTDETSPRGEYCDSCFDEVAEPYLPRGYEIFEQGDFGIVYERTNNKDERLPDGFYWWSCQPGCLPDGDPSGPFKTEDEALRDCVSVYEY